MTTRTEGNHTGEFIVSEANGVRSREEIVVAEGQDLGAGQVLGIVTADDTYAAYDDQAADGTEVAVGVLYADVDATDGEVAGVAVVRDAEVAASKLVWGSADADAGTADLATVGVISR